MTDAEFDSIYEESKCDGSRDKIIAYLFDQRKALNRYIDFMERHADPDLVHAARDESGLALGPRYAIAWKPGYGENDYYWCGHPDGWGSIVPQPGALEVVLTFATKELAEKELPSAILSRPNARIVAIGP